MEQMVFDKLREAYELLEAYTEKVDKVQKKFDDWYMLVVDSIARITKLERDVEELKWSR